MRTGPLAFMPSSAPFAHPAARLQPGTRPPVQTPPAPDSASCWKGRRGGPRPHVRRAGTSSTGPAPPDITRDERGAQYKVFGQTRGPIAPPPDGHGKATTRARRTPSSNKPRPTKTGRSRASSYDEGAPAKPFPGANPGTDLSRSVRSIASVAQRNSAGSRRRTKS